MFRISDGKYFGIRLLSTKPPDFYQSGGFWEFVYVKLILHQLKAFLAKQSYDA